MATFAGVTLEGVVGTPYTLRFTATGLTLADATNVQVSGPGTATQIAVAAGDQQSAAVGTAVATTPIRRGSKGLGIR